MTMDPRLKDVRDIRTTHLFDMVVDLNPRLLIGPGRFGRRILFGAAGGTFPRPQAARRSPPRRKRLGAVRP